MVYKTGIISYINAINEKADVNTCSIQFDLIHKKRVPTMIIGTHSVAVFLFGFCLFFSLFRIIGPQLVPRPHFCPP